MGNVIATFKRFLSNKNTVTIIGILIGIVVLYLGYNYQIDKAIDTIVIPYAKETITATTEITSTAVSTTEVLRSFVNSTKNIISNYNSLINTTTPMCVTYGTSVPAGAFFYSEQVVTCNNVPASVLADMPDGYVPFSLAVNIQSTYGNSMYPGDYIDLYVKMTSTDNKIIYGKFIQSIQIRDVRDSTGKSVFITSEAKSPSVLLFAVPEDLYLLLAKANYVTGVNLIPVPKNASYTINPGETSVTSEYLRNEILKYTSTIPDEVVMPTTD